MAENGVYLQTDDEKKNDYGVLLYYKYAEIPHLQDLFEFYHSNCTSLSLLGRVRLSPHGVNVTVGGRLSALKKHIDLVKSNALFEETDFKLASCSQPVNDQVAKECGFTSVCIRIVKELVTLSSHPLLKSPRISNAGKHLSAAEFHSVLQNAGKCEERTLGSEKKLILLDARNLYETRIGKFDNPDVQTLDPEIRQYSDLPTWIDNNSEQLRGNDILMYCTGGIRCEMASAYIRSKGAGFENVFQLYGGIQRYMEQFPDGGFFKGKNFVFDHRVSVGSSNTSILGACLLCRTSFDDYTSRCRCTHCRMLVLVCEACQEKHSSYVCELCQKNGKPTCSNDVSEEVLEPTSHDHNFNIDQASEGQCTSTAKKLRILCLHGFRQNASSFKGRTASLAKKLKNIVEFVFVDAPHELRFIYQLDQNGRSAKQPPPPSNHCSRKFAWLVAADDGNQCDGWKMAEAPFDSVQYQQQTQGLEKSVEYLKTVFAKLGPFDGLLGFSQGAAMAALVMKKLKGKVDFRFVILCSGFAVNIADCADGGPMNCPSLHIFGSKEGGDRQIDCEASRHLATMFHKDCCVVIEHDLGHIIPTRSPYIDEIKNFLTHFL